jgi:hypothetical protein
MDKVSIIIGRDKQHIRRNVQDNLEQNPPKRVIDIAQAHEYQIIKQ